jgi:hypothetical protein
MTTSDKAMNARTAAPDAKEKAMFFLDLVYTERSKDTLRFRWMKAPTSASFPRLAQTLARLASAPSPSRVFPAVPRL